MQILEMSAPWEHEKRAAIRSARVQGFVLGFFANAVSVILLGWMIS